MNLLRGEIVLVEIPYHQEQGAKVRPAVVIDTGDEDFLAAPVTSRVRDGTYEIAIEAWQAAGHASMAIS
jgi:mRNA-degrading endonuclease toxin of MazEF toxin-antitoxin module